MKKSIILLLLITSITVFGQTKKEMLTQKWQLNMVEEFGDQFSPMENQKNDWISFSEDGKFTGVIENLHTQGEWIVKDDKTILTLNKQLSKVKINWIRETTVSKTQFSFKYQNGDLITSTLIFIPAE